jgi:hypothetical protein
LLDCELDRGEAGKSDRPRRRWREVNDPSAHEWTPV